MCVCVCVIHLRTVSVLGGATEYRDVVLVIFGEKDGELLPLLPSLVVLRLVLLPLQF